MNPVNPTPVRNSSTRETMYIGDSAKKNRLTPNRIIIPSSSQFLCLVFPSDARYMLPTSEPTPATVSRKPAPSAFSRSTSLPNAGSTCTYAAPKNPNAKLMPTSVKATGVTHTNFNPAQKSPSMFASLLWLRDSTPLIISRQMLPTT